MQVGELAPKYVASCRLETSLVEAARLLWEHNCGILPVVDASFHLEGVLTDRDICMALATHREAVHALCAKDVMSAPVQWVGAYATVSQALKLMRRHHLRRLPVASVEGVLEGMLSLDDIIMATPPELEGTPERPGMNQLLPVLQALCTRTTQKHAAPPPLPLIHT